MFVAGLDKKTFLFPLGYFYQHDADEYPYYFTHAADDADEDAEGSGEPEGSYGEYEAAFLHAYLHGEEAYEVGKECGECHDEYGVEVGKEDAV